MISQNQTIKISIVISIKCKITTWKQNNPNRILYHSMLVFFVHAQRMMKQSKNKSFTISSWRLGILKQTIKECICQHMINRNYRISYATTISTVNVSRLNNLEESQQIKVILIQKLSKILYFSIIIYSDLLKPYDGFKHNVCCILHMIQSFNETAKAIIIINPIKWSPK